MLPTISESSSPISVTSSAARDAVFHSSFTPLSKPQKWAKPEVSAPEARKKVVDHSGDSNSRNSVTLQASDDHSALRANREPQVPTESMVSARPASMPNRSSKDGASPLEFRPPPASGQEPIPSPSPTKSSSDGASLIASRPAPDGRLADFGVHLVAHQNVMPSTVLEDEERSHQKFEGPKEDVLDIGARIVALFHESFAEDLALHTRNIGIVIAQERRLAVEQTVDELQLRMEQLVTEQQKCVATLVKMDSNLSAKLDAKFEYMEEMLRNTGSGRPWVESEPLVPKRNSRKLTHLRQWNPDVKQRHLVDRTAISYPLDAGINSGSLGSNSATASVVLKDVAPGTASASALMKEYARLPDRGISSMGNSAIGSVKLGNASCDASDFMEQYASGEMSPGRDVPPRDRGASRVRFHNGAAERTNSKRSCATQRSRMTQRSRAQTEDTFGTSAVSRQTSHQSSAVAIEETQTTARRVEAAVEDIKALHAAQFLIPLEPPLEPQRRLDSELEGGRLSLNFQDEDTVTPALVNRIAVILVAFNAIFQGFKVHYDLEAAFRGEQPPFLLVQANTAFMIAFVIENFTRMVIFKSEFWTGDDAAWNLFCLFCTGGGVIDMLIEWSMGRDNGHFEFTIFRVFRITRVIRITRNLHFLRFLRPLRLIVASLLSSGILVMWGSIVLLSLTYIFAISFGEIVSSFVRHHDNDIPLDDLDLIRLKKHFGSLGSAGASLFMAITGGVVWEDIVWPLVRHNFFYICLFMAFILISMLSIWNVLTALIVADSSHIMNVDKDLVIQEELSNQQFVKHELRKMFQATDADGSGNISSKNLETLFLDAETLTYLSVLELDVSQARSLFKLLDEDNLGIVPIEDLISGMMRLKGTSKTIDIATILYEHKQLSSRLSLFMEFTQENFRLLSEHFGNSSGSIAEEANAADEHDADETSSVPNIEMSRPLGVI